MDFLVDNPLALMEGPIFLVLYGFVITVSILFVALHKTQVDRTDKLGPPSIPPEFDPFEIAYLRGGDNELARAIIFSLMQKGLVEVTSSGKSGTIRKSENATGLRLSTIESEAMGWLGTEHEVKEVFNSTRGLVRQLKRTCEVYEYQLEQRNLLLSDELKASSRRAGRIAAMVIAGLGTYKIFAAVMNGNFNILFTILFGIVGVSIALVVSRLPRITKAGHSYLSRLQLAFEDLKYQATPARLKIEPALAGSQAGFSRVDPLMLSVGIFGTSVLAGTAYAGYNDAFHRAQQQTAGGGTGGCGSSCSGGSSSDGGGSSCSSGGCGGCGGGCGG